MKVHLENGRKMREISRGEKDRLGAVHKILRVSRDDVFGGEEEPPIWIV
jgi:hypothetical protein